MVNNFPIQNDWRNKLKKWIELKCPGQYQLRYIRMKAARFRLISNLPDDLIDRYKNGLFAVETKGWVRNCGKHGECQENKETNKRRFVGFYCNERSFCLSCAMRYRAGQGIESKNQYMEIAKAQNLWGFYSWTFTLPGQVRVWIDKSEDKKKFLSDVRRAIAKTIKECLGVNTKTRGVQPGFSILYHAVSSGNPFKPLPHFHSLILPLLANLKNQTIKHFQSHYDHSQVKRVYKKHLDRILVKYGLEYLIRDQYVVHLRDVFVDMPGSVDHAFKYNNRSQVQDILRTIKRVSDDFQSFVGLISDKKEGVYIPYVKNRKEIIDALDYVLHPDIQIRMSYGFMRVLEKYSILLGVERDDYDDDENWERLYLIDIMRVQKMLYDEEKNKVIPILTVYIRGPDSDDWKQIDPGELRGEKSNMADRKLFKAIGGKKS